MLYLFNHPHFIRLPLQNLKFLTMEPSPLLGPKIRLRILFSYTHIIIYYIISCYVFYVIHLCFPQLTSGILLPSGCDSIICLGFLSSHIRTICPKTFHCFIFNLPSIQNCPNSSLIFSISHTISLSLLYHLINM